MRSLWQRTSPPIPTDRFIARAASDAIVVGAGLTGLATALLLARSGMRVTVLEARFVGAVTTGNTTGKLSLLQGDVLSGIQEHAGDEALAAYVEANRAGQSWLLAQMAKSGITPDFRPAYSFAFSADGATQLKREYQACQVAGLAAEWVQTPELPFETAGALMLPDQVAIHAMQILAMLAQEFRSLGGILIENCRVLDAHVQTTDGTHDVQVETEHGQVTAGVVVLASGTPILDRSLFFARLEPSRSIVAVYEIPENLLPHGMYLSVDSPVRSLRSAHDEQGNNVLVAGGDSHVTGRSTDTQEAFAELHEWVGQQYPGARRRHQWAAQDYRSHSYLPYAGPIHGAEGLVYTATGYNKWGLANSVAAALAICGQITGDAPSWHTTLRESSVGLKDLKDAASANASILANLASGWAKVVLSTSVDPELVQEGEGEIIREGLAPIATARINNTLCQVSGVCTHMGAVLNWNRAEQSWDCPLHGSRFNPYGEVLEGPAVQNLERY